MSVRDRDRIRQEILESLGWRGRIWRIWSTDWFRTPRQETEKLIRFLEDQRGSWKPEHASGESWIEEGQAEVKLTTDASKLVEQVENRSGSAYLNRFTPRDKDTAGGLNGCRVVHGDSCGQLGAHQGFSFYAAWAILGSNSQ